MRVGTRVQDVLDKTPTGTVVSHQFKMLGSPGKFQVVQLDIPLWTTGKEMFITHAVFHVSNLEKIKQ